MQRFLIQGNEKIRLQQYEQAEQYFFSALKLDSCFADALNNLGTLEHRRRNSTKAIEYYSRAISCHGEFGLAIFNRANVYYETGQTDQALTDLTRVEKIWPDSANVTHLRGLIFWKKRQWNEAIRQFRILLDKNLNTRDMMINIGTLYTDANQLDSAEWYLSRALELNSNDAQALNAMAMLKLEKADTSAAITLIDRAAAVSPRDAYILNNKGYILLMKGEHDKALALINESITIDPYNGWAYRNKGIHAHLIKRYDEALRLLGQAQKMDPYIKGLSYWLGTVHLAKGDRAEACRYFREAVDRGDTKLKDVPSVCDN